MQVNRWHTPSLPVVFVLLGLTGLSATLFAATKESGGKAADLPKVISPPDRSVLLSGQLDVIYRGEKKAKLKVDSRDVPWEQLYDKPVQVGHLHLSPGIHRLQVGDLKVQTCVALNEMEYDAPSDWKIYRVHTMSAEKDRCAECHDAETRDGRMVVGPAIIPDLCMACHTESEVADTHKEIVQPLKSCDTCHVMHGTPYDHILKAPEAQIREKYGIGK